LKGDRHVRVNTTKEKLQAGGVVAGCFVRHLAPALVEFMALQGWDFLVFDAEHGPLQPADVEQLVRAAELRGTTPITRVTTNAPHVILRFLDVGSQGVHVPWVNGATEAEAAVRSVKYGPRGQRGLAGGRASDWDFAESIADYTRRANEETLVVIHIETAVAVEQLDEYLAVDGIDVLFVGPTDLSHSLGHPGEVDHPDVRSAIDRVAEVVVGSPIAFGIYAGTPAAAIRWKEDGARYLTTGLEGMLRPGTDEYLAALRT
jgi:4-hydroxy-2-oxoheptanedioate aldolase